jgi:WD40 repeat protein
LVVFLTFSPDGKLLAAAGFDAAVTIWDVSTGNSIRTIRMSDWRGFAFSRDSKVFATADGSKAMLWDVATGKRLRTFDRSYAKTVAFSQDGRLLAIVDFDM